MTSWPVRYHIDQHDRLDRFNEGWVVFAEANDGHALHPSRIRGRTLWEFVTEPTTAQLYQRVLSRLRQGGSAIALRLRCDAPDRRRLLTMEMTADHEGGIQFEVTPVFEESRPPVALLDTRRALGADLLVVCAWCNRIHVPLVGWKEVEEATVVLRLFETVPLPQLTHGVCSDCSDGILAMVEA